VDQRDAGSSEPPIERHAWPGSASASSLTSFVATAAALLLRTVDWQASGMDQRFVPVGGSQLTASAAAAVIGLLASSGRTTESGTREIVRQIGGRILDDTQALVRRSPRQRLAVAFVQASPSNVILRLGKLVELHPRP